MKASISTGISCCAVRLKDSPVTWRSMYRFNLAAETVFRLLVPSLLTWAKNAAGSIYALDSSRTA